MAQALVKFLNQQFIDVDGEEYPFIRGVATGFAKQKKRRQIPLPAANPSRKWLFTWEKDHQWVNGVAYVEKHTRR
ncbi:conserved hypothetical protein [Xenorhabdus bovienii SS-2004]|uniref:Uncharacterized protein n=1 Tax=Xenorhabdus bovienii (strain SS-2004) TaxID=406818 RepID=D3UZW6_XENBS|nr:conserved hypothetical protein [Xenorhabdus bovienii SS-2004]